MREASEREYREFVKGNDRIVVDGKPVRLVDCSQIDLFEPEGFSLQKTTVWSFENRGAWATHRGDYRGNWAPEIPRNLILRYTQPGDVVLDQMVGSGTTMVECKLLARNGIGIDVNLGAVMVAWNRTDFAYVGDGQRETTQRLFVGDARRLDLIDDATVDLVATHPPYANIIPYSHETTEGDLSRVHSIGEFVEGMHQVAAESHRVLKPGAHCGILIGDTHKHRHFVPISSRVLLTFLDVGFVLREDVIKEQWHTQTMRGRWKHSGDHDFLLTYHEHLLIFRKLAEDEKPSKYKASMKWW